MKDTILWVLLASVALGTVRSMFGDAVAFHCASTILYMLIGWHIASKKDN